MTEPLPAGSSWLIDALVSVTMLDVEQASTALAAAPKAGRPGGLEDLRRLVSQAPLSHADRRRLLASLEAGLADVDGGQVATATELVGSTMPRFPTAAGQVTLGPLDPSLTAALRLLFALDELVETPWTLIGGLMVLLHCSEHGVAFSRPTGDADVAVGVFTHRGALLRLTGVLRERGFADVTTAPLTGGEPLSYRWSDGLAKVDVAVPPKANAQRDRPVTATGRPAVELPATQQALRRTERLLVTLEDGSQGTVRRPDLMAALVIKAQATVSDRRDTDRHREDLVSLCEALAVSGSYLAYRDQVRSKDVKRLLGAAETVRPAFWRQASDPVAARSALAFMTGADIG